MSCLVSLDSWLCNQRLGIKPTKPCVFYRDEALGLVIKEVKEDWWIMQVDVFPKAVHIFPSSEGLEELHAGLNHWQWFAPELNGAFSGLDTWLKEARAFFSKEGL